MDHFPAFHRSQLPPVRSSGDILLADCRAGSAFVALPWTNPEMQMGKAALKFLPQTSHKKCEVQTKQGDESEFAKKEKLLF